jgi:hypothetical protein
MKSKDSILLLITGILCATAAWAYWACTGKYGLRIIIIALLVTLFIDNLLLRRKQKNSERP